jgi:hypothetical protein
MSLVQLFVHTEVAHDTVAELAALGNVQFKDVSWDFFAHYSGTDTSSLVSLIPK